MVFNAHSLQRRLQAPQASYLSGTIAGMNPPSACRVELATGEIITLCPVRSAADVRAAAARGPRRTTGVVLYDPDDALLLAVARYDFRVVISETAINSVDGNTGAQETLHKEIREHLRDHSVYIDPRLTGELWSALSRMAPRLDPLLTLSSRERTVLTQLVKGGTNRHIAETLFVSEHTVRNQLRSIYQKLDVHTRQEACQVWAEFGAADVSDPDGSSGEVD